MRAEYDLSYPQSRGRVSAGAGEEAVVLVAIHRRTAESLGASFQGLFEDRGGCEKRASVSVRDKGQEDDVTYITKRDCYVKSLIFFA